MAPIRLAWLWLAPPVVLAGVRTVLVFLAARQPPTLAQPLSPVSAPGSLQELLWPVLAVVAVLLAAVGLLRQWGWRRAAPGLAVGWAVLWGLGGAALVQRHLNVQRLQPLPPQVAQLLSSQFVPPSQRGTGGTKLYLKLPSLAAPHTVLLNDPQAAQLQPGDAVALRLAGGRFDGLFLTGWQAVPARTGVRQPDAP